MNLDRILARLREELGLINRAINELERLPVRYPRHRNQGRMRARPATPRTRHAERSKVDVEPTDSGGKSV